MDIRRILFLYEDPDFFLGDNCIILYKLGKCTAFFPEGTAVDLNVVSERYSEKYRALCVNNAHFSNLSFLPLADIDYQKYEMVVYMSPDERALLTAMEGVKAGPVVLSLSKAVFSRKKNVLPAVFPLHEELYSYSQGLEGQPYELYLSDEERVWGDEWLEERGVRKGGRVFVLVDNASNRKKLLRLDVYYQVLRLLLDMDDVKILVFDEVNSGKEQFYRKWLGEQDGNKLIFSNGLRLREDLCLIGSRYVKLVFGPCTGLLHCASAIYNHLKRKGMSEENLPALVVYTGDWDASLWWSASPLVDCLVLLQNGGRRVMATLEQMSDAEKANLSNRMECSQYTGDMLTSFLEEKISYI